MTVRRRVVRLANGKTSRRWVVDVKFRHTDGRIERVRQASPDQSKSGAEKLERAIRNRLESLADATPTPSVPVPVPVPTLAQFWERFHATHVLVNNKPSEVANKRKIMLLHLLPRFGPDLLTAISAVRIESYKAELRELGYQPKTINNHLTVLKTLLRTAEAWDVLARAPRFKLLRVPQPDFRFLTYAEAETVIDAADPVWRPMVIVALCTGLRIGELLALRWEDTNLARYSIRVCRNDWQGVVGTPKSGKDREIPLNHRASTILQALARRGSLVFCHPSGRPWTYREANYAFSKIAARAQVQPLQWHSLRHTFASHLVMRGVSLRAVQELLGHGTLAMTERYAHLTPDIKRSAVMTLDGRDHKNGL